MLAVKMTFDSIWSSQKDGRRSFQRALRCAQIIGESMPVSEIVPLHLADVRRFLEGEGLGPASVNRHMSAIQRVLAFMFELGVIDTRVTLGRRTEPRGRTRVFTNLELDHIRYHCASLRWPLSDQMNALVRLLAETGMRLSEALNLQWQDFEVGPGGADQGFVLVNIDESKNGDYRTVPIMFSTYGWLRKACNGDEVGRQDTKVFKMSKSRVERLWSEIRAKFDPETIPNPSECVIHMLRHTCASRMLNKGIPITTIQKWLGHRDIKTTTRYAHLDNSVLIEAAQIMRGEGEAK